MKKDGFGMKKSRMEISNEANERVMEKKRF